MTCEGFIRNLNLIMCVACSSSNSTLVKRTIGGSIRACASALRHWPFFMAYVLVSVDGFPYVTHSDFEKCRTC